jgi:hypothetical protein
MRFRILLITHYLIQEILGKIVLDFHVRGVKIKIFFNLDVVTMHLLQKEFMKKYLCWFSYREPYVPHETMVEWMVESTSSSSNVHGIVDDNSNP